MRRSVPPGTGVAGGMMADDPGPAGGRAKTWLVFDQANVTGPRPFGGILGRELDALPFAEQLEYGAAYGTAVEEVFDAAFIANESESLVDEEACDSPGRHGRVLRCA